MTKPPAWVLIRADSQQADFAWVFAPKLGIPHGQVRRALSRALSALEHAGRCNVCGYRGLFRVRPEAWDNLRETLDCPRCRSISRDRFLAAVIAFCLGKPPIMAAWPVDKSAVVREPSAYRGRTEMLAQKVDYCPFNFPEEKP